MSFVPTVFIVADKEDDDARRQLLRLYLDHGVEDPSTVTDGFLDYSCLLAAEKEVGDTMYLHRCLQHTKTDIRAAAATKSTKTGAPRLRNPELLTFIVDQIEWMATLPTGWPPCRQVHDLRHQRDRTQAPHFEGSLRWPMDVQRRS